jgi:hypothetical protein
MRCKANHVYSEWLRAWRQRRRAWSAARAAAREWWEDTPFEPESSGGDNEEEDENIEEGVVTPPHHSTLPEDIPSLGDIFNRQAGISVGPNSHWYPLTYRG